MLENPVRDCVLVNPVRDCVLENPVRDCVLENPVRDCVLENPVRRLLAGFCCTDFSSVARGFNGVLTAPLAVLTLLTRWILVVLV